jgi:hypothetical protein
METDDDDDSAWFKTTMQDAVEGRFELFQFVVDGDAQGLKHLGGWVPTRWRSHSANGRPGGRVISDNGAGEVESRVNRSVLTPCDDVAGHPPTVRLFAVMLEEFDKLLFAQSCEKCRGGFSLSDIEPQIERPVGCKAESARMVGQLIGRQPEVEQNAIGRRDSQTGQDGGELGITGLMEVTAKGRKLTGRNFQHQAVAVKTD